MKRANVAKVDVAPRPVQKVSRERMSERHRERKKERERQTKMDRPRER